MVRLVPQHILIRPQGLFQASHLAGENDLRGIIRSLQIDTFIATGTPPQAAGVNSNTERVAGSERITNFALDSFDRRGGLPSPTAAASLPSHCAVQPSCGSSPNRCSTKSLASSLAKCSTWQCWVGSCPS